MVTLSLAPFFISLQCSRFISACRSVDLLSYTVVVSGLEWIALLHWHEDLNTKK
jgi:hypothetical protein